MNTVPGFFVALVTLLILQETKVVLLEDLAAHFKMKTQDTIDRVTKLSAEGLLTGKCTHPIWGSISTIYFCSKVV